MPIRLDKSVSWEELRHWGRFQKLVFQMSSPIENEAMTASRLAKEHLIRHGLRYTDRPKTVAVSIRKMFPGRVWRGGYLHNFFDNTRRRLTAEDWQGRLVAAISQLQADEDKFVHITSITKKVMANRDRKHAARLPKHFSALIRDALNRCVKKGILIRGQRGFYKLN